MRELFQRFFRHPWLSFQLVTASLFVNFLALATSLFVIQVLNRFVSYGVTTTLVTLVTGTVIAILFEVAFRAVRRRLIRVQHEEENNLLSEKVFSILLQTKIPVLDRVPVGQRQEILRGIDTLRTVTEPQTVAAVLDIPFAFLFLFVLWLLSPPLALISVVIMSLVVIISLVAQYTGRLLTKETQEKVADRSAILGSAISGADTLRTFNGGPFFMKGWCSTDHLVATLTGKIAHSRDILRVRIGMLTGLQTVAIISVGALLVVNGDLSVGAMIGANILAGLALMPVSKLSQMGETFSKATQASARIKEFLKLPQERSEGTALKHYSGALEFKDLAFVYPGSSVPLFESVNLQLDAGKVMVVVGHNGSGKTTFARLLMGVLEPSRGQVLLDGLDLQQVALTWWRRQVGYLPQEPMFVTGTIGENIALANSEITLDQLNEVIRVAGLRPFLDSSQEGISMVIREGGRHLALGIRRRLALARALATGGNPFIADEPTEGLDAEGRRAVYAAFQQLRREDKTIVVISHDQEFLKIADYRVDFGVKPTPGIQARRSDSNAEQNDGIVAVHQERTG